MRIWLTAFIWIVIMVVAATASEFYKTLRHPKTLESWVQDYEKDWTETLKDVKANPPPVTKEFLKTKRVPLGQHGVLTPKFAELDKKYQPDYEKKATDYYDKVDREFKVKWQDAIEKGDDSPTVEAMLKDVPAFHVEKLKERLAKTDETMNNKHPRINLAIDAFSGYCVFRSPEFMRKLTESKIKLHLVDDEANYEKRIEKLQKGETQLAVFTIDALINNSALFKGDDPPGKIVLVIDESVGADAIIGYDPVVADLDALKRADMEIIATENSPSETLARLVCAEKKLPLDRLVTKKSVQEVYELAKTSSTEPRAFVLWEPFATRLKKERAKSRVLIDSANAKARGYFVDVLVVQKKFLDEHRKDRVEPIVRAYLEALNIHRQRASGMKDLVLIDAKKSKDGLTDDEAKEIAAKIGWRTFNDNCAHFGLEATGQLSHIEPMKTMIAKINDLLVSTGAISKDWKNREEVFFDLEICKALQAAKFPQDDAPTLKEVAGAAKPLVFRAGSETISEESEDALKEVAKLLKDNPTYVAEVRGHVAEVGDIDANKKLSDTRADAVFRWLRDTGGVSADRIKKVVVGPSTENARAGITVAILQPG